MAPPTLDLAQDDETVTSSRATVSANAPSGQVNPCLAAESSQCHIVFAGNNDVSAADSDLVPLLTDIDASEPSLQYQLPRMPLRSFKLTDNPPAVILDFNNLITTDQARNMFEAVDQANIVDIEPPRRGQGRIKIEFASLEHAQAALNHRLERSVREDTRDKIVQDRLDLMSNSVGSKLAQLDQTIQMLQKDARAISKSVDENLTIYVEQNAAKAAAPALITIPDDDELDKIKDAMASELRARLQAEYDNDLEALEEDHKREKLRLQKEKNDAKKLLRKSEQDSTKLKAEIQKMKSAHDKEKAKLIKEHERKRQRSPSPRPDIRVRAPSVSSTLAAHLATPPPSKSPRLESFYRSSYIKSPPQTPKQSGSKRRPDLLALGSSPMTPSRSWSLGDSVDRLNSGGYQLATPKTSASFETFVGQFHANSLVTSPEVLGISSPAVCGLPPSPCSPSFGTPGKKVEIILLDSDSEGECIKEETAIGDTEGTFQMRSGRPARKSAAKGDASLKKLIKSCGMHRSK